MSLKQKIPVYYQYQNRNDKTINIYTFPNLWEDQSQIKVKHVLMFFPHSFNENKFHFRFKIQCEKSQKQMAWLDILNMNAKVPIINGGIHMKILDLQDHQQSKIYTKEKLQNLQKIKEEEIQRLKGDNKEINQKPKNDLNQKQSQTQPKIQEDQQNSRIILTQKEKSELIKQKQLKEKERQYQVQQQQKQRLEENLRKKQKEEVERKKQEEEEQHKQQQQNQKQEDLVDFDHNQGDQIDMDDWGLGDNSNTESQNNQQQQNNNNQDVLQKQTKQIWGKSQHSSNLLDQKTDIDYDGNVKIIVQLSQKEQDQVNKQKQQKLDEHKKIIQEQGRIALFKQQNQQKIKDKVNNWSTVQSQRQNVRKLLSSVQDILWEGADWEPYTLSQLLDNRSVTKAYHNALRKIHPDKNKDKPIEVQQLAEAIIREIQLSYKEFQQR